MSQLADLRFEHPHDDVVVAGVAGELDRSNAQSVGEAIEATVPNAALTLILDLSDTTYLDSSGIHLLFDLRSRLERRQQRLLVVVPEGARIARVLSVVALERSVGIHPSLPEALEAARANAG